MATTEPATAPIDPQAIYAEMARLARFLHPTAKGSEYAIILETGERSVINVPLGNVSPEVAKVAEAIVTALETLKPGATMSGPVLAAAVQEATGDETTHDGGTFGRAIKHLKQIGKLPPLNTGGYRLKS